jgi:hypothetical protein
MLAQGEEEATPTKERMTMFALVEGHPNIDVIIFYVLVSAILQRRSTISIKDRFEVCRHKAGVYLFADPRRLQPAGNGF